MDHTGIFRNGREFISLWEESTSLGSKRIVQREKRAREQYKGEKIAVAVKRNNSPSFSMPSRCSGPGIWGFHRKEAGGPKLTDGGDMARVVWMKQGAQPQSPYQSTGGADQHRGLWEGCVFPHIPHRHTSGITGREITPAASFTKPATELMLRSNNSTYYYKCVWESPSTISYILRNLGRAKNC